MKDFFKNYAVVLIATVAFLWFGGFQLFDFSRHFFLASASVSFLLAAAATIWSSQQDKIDQLEKRIEALEDQLNHKEKIS